MKTQYKVEMSVSYTLAADNSVHIDKKLDVSSLATYQIMSNAEQYNMTKFALTFLNLDNSIFDIIDEMIRNNNDSNILKVKILLGNKEVHKTTLIPKAINIIERKENVSHFQLMCHSLIAERMAKSYDIWEEISSQGSGDIYKTGLTHMESILTGIKSKYKVGSRYNTRGLSKFRYVNIHVPSVSDLKLLSQINKYQPYVIKPHIILDSSGTTDKIIIINLNDIHKYPQSTKLTDMNSGVLHEKNIINPNVVTDYKGIILLKYSNGGTEQITFVEKNINKITKVSTIVDKTEYSARIKARVKIAENNGKYKLFKHSNVDFGSISFLSVYNIYGSWDLTPISIVSTFVQENNTYSVDIQSIMANIPQSFRKNRKEI
jgi:hypothetical protein